MASFANWIRAAFIYTVRYAIPYLPRFVVYRLAEAIGWARRNSEESRIVQSELRRLLGRHHSGKELQAIAVTGIANHKKDIFEIWSFPRLSPARLPGYAYLDGAQHIDRALTKGNGAVIAVSHFGSWKMTIAALAYSGYRVNQLGLDPRHFIGQARPHHHNVIMELEHRSDQSLPANFIYIGKFLRDVFRVLEANELLIDSLDGFMGARHLEAEFLCGRNRVALGPIIVAARSSAPLLPTFAVREEDDRHRIVIREPIHLDDQLPREQAIRKAAHEYLDVLADYVAKYPSHYCRTIYERTKDPSQ